METVEFDNKTAFKKLWVTNALDGFEDLLVDGRTISLLGESMRDFRIS